MTHGGLVYGFGDNTKGQIVQNKNELCIREPRLIEKAKKYREDLIKIHTNDTSSLITTFNEKVRAPLMFQWGGCSIIDTYAELSSVLGTSLNPENGTHIKGGSQYDREVRVVDQHQSGQ